MHVNSICRRRVTSWSALGLAAFAVTGVPAQDATLTQQEIEFFETKIRPALVEYCYDCHSSQARRVRGDYLLDSRDIMRLGGPSGPGIVPGDPDASMVVRAIRGDLDDLVMPPGDELPDQVIADIEQWVRMGAPDPRTPDVVGETEPLWTREIDFERAREYWAFVPPTPAALPDIRRENWPRTEIDHYVLAKMEEHGLKPIHDTDRATLIRRLSFDLIGLPSTPEEVQAFVSNRSPDAVEELVDRLLASAQFGERWGRHWLDVARYAESSGKESNIVYPHAWRYRDYVIDSFNADKPYDEFLAEQIAGDLLPAEDADERAEQMIATSYLAIGTKGHNTRGKPQFVADLVDEQIDAVTQGMLGLTVACARCHDHKFDPIPTTDYYAMAGIFMSTETLYGTAQSAGNRHPSGLIELPDGADVSPGTSMPTPALSALQRRETQLTDQIAELEREIRASGGARQNRTAAVRLRNTRNQLNNVQEVLSRFDDDGDPVADALMTMGVREAARARDARVLIRGELEKAGDTVPRGFLTVLAQPDDPTINGGSGREELAGWIASDSNPLTARVWANRVWLHLLGAPLVPTPDNFGSSGLPPTHPELLDHLALTLIEHEWSTKALIREIVLSRVYQLASASHSGNHAIDPDNVYLWRSSLRRLEGEAIRDAMLSVSGQLDLNRPAGSPVSLTEGRVREPRGRQTDDPLANVRSVYLPVVRDNVPEALAVFDFAEPSFVTGNRDETNVPSQALYMLNDPTVISIAESFAQRLMGMDATPQERLEHAFLLAFGREPTSTEERAVRAFFEDFGVSQLQDPPQAEERRGNRRDGAQRRRRRQSPDAARDELRLQAWTAFCQSLFASAEFQYVG